VHLANNKSEERDSAQHGFQRIIKYINLLSYYPAILGRNDNNLIQRRRQSSKLFNAQCRGADTYRLSLFFLAGHPISKKDITFNNSYVACVKSCQTLLKNEQTLFLVISISGFYQNCCCSGCYYSRIKLNLNLV